MGNSACSGNTSGLTTVRELLAATLPPGWATGARRSRRKTGDDDTLTLRAPDSTEAIIRVLWRRRVEPKDVTGLAAELTLGPRRALLIAAPFLSPRTRELLKQRGVAYADGTGNLRLALTDPALFIETTGAREDPSPPSRERRSLKGAKAGRVVRTLCDFRAPLGLRELARRAGVDAGYVSRVVDILTREALVRREPKGPIGTVDWPALLRRWSSEYSPFRRDRVTWYLAARGLNAVVERLREARTPYAVSGSWAATQYAPVAPPRLMVCYTESLADLAQALDLRSTDSGANVALALPFDSVVFERTTEKKGVRVAAVSQVAADLLTSPGRGPNEAEALIEWMRENEDAWRS
jgi:hypothetical protein